MAPPAPAVDYAPAGRVCGASWLARVVLTTSVRYWVCLGVLLVAAVGLRTAAQTFGLTVRKEPLPLKKPLERFDWAKLAPRYELNRALNERLPDMDEDTLDSLGTRQYLQKYLTDTQASPQSTAQVAMLFITYYENPDAVPHVPEECRVAAGYEVVQDTMQRVPVRGLGVPQDQLNVSVVEFQNAQRGEHPTVAYLFLTNGGFACTRNEVRTAMVNPFIHYGYYSKIEISFSDKDGRRAATPADAQAALGPLLEHVLPVLLTEHIDLDTFAAPRGGASPK